MPAHDDPNYTYARADCEQQQTSQKQSHENYINAQKAALNAAYPQTVGYLQEVKSTGPGRLEPAAVPDGLIFLANIAEKAVAGFYVSKTEVQLMAAFLLGTTISE